MLLEVIMSFRSNVVRASILSVVVLCLGFGAFADTIRMKDGSKVKGKIVGFSGGKFVVAVGDGSRRREMTLVAADIESIDFDTPRSTDTNVLASNRTSTPPTSVVSSNRGAQSQPSSPASSPTRGDAGSTDVQTSTRVIKPTNKPVLQNDPGEYKDTTPPKIEDGRVGNNKPASTPVEEDEEIVSVPSTVGKTPPQISTPAKTAPSTSQPTTAAKKPSFAKPVELSVKVLADNTSNGWTNSGWVVKKGQKIRISGTGEVSIGGGKMTGPGGLYDIDDNSKLLKSVPTGALIAVIGDDNNEFIYIGTEREFVASRDGSLFLGLNEGNLNDNKGSFDVKVEISPDGGE